MARKWQEDLTLKAVLQSIILSAIINLRYFFGELAIGFVQTVLYRPNLPGTDEGYFLQQSIAFGYTGNYLAALSIRLGLGVLLIVILLKILATRRAAK